MAKKKYSTPVWEGGLVVEDDPVITIGGSQGTGGQNVIYDFENEDLEALLGDYDYFVLAAIDACGVEDGYIGTALGVEVYGGNGIEAA